LGASPKVNVSDRQQTRPSQVAQVGGTTVDQRISEPMNEDAAGR